MRYATEDVVGVTSRAGINEPLFYFLSEIRDGPAQKVGEATGAEQNKPGKVLKSEE